MPAAVTHVVVSIVVVDLFRKYVLKKKDFPLYLILLAGIAGLLPDIDVLVYWILQSFGTASLLAIHRNFTHTLVIPVLFLLFALIFWKKETVFHIFLVLSAGWTIHVLLDALLSGTMPLFYPFSSALYGLNLIPFDSLSGTFYYGLDAIVLVLWLIYEYFAQNMRDYI